ncbi:hypothetical protein GXW83_04670 [Streptacidiphilus sp. PB12-B1b]|uniref:DUF6542 domain-containing protein n=1 Tax=Streptacidiphilus sp. PB12-B1b TaxID=2705012 RepID=UPI0015F89CA5|nr:DUF6542 domain-containing protein [Streptacidiphilus sp. PB12-B1b]QMU75158.1 hypothetical protein GXW83_04670 [Streptacidiphilus sp. PB12-B1b]
MEHRRRFDERPAVMAAPGVPSPARSLEPSHGHTPGAPGLRARGDGRPQPRPGGGRTPHRLTAVGGAVVTLGGTFAGGALDTWLFGGSGVLMGLVYVVVCFQVAVRVRPVDLAAAPISGPIAFAVTLGVLNGPANGGVIGRLIGLATSLALQAGWLFTGTAVSVVIAVARHVALGRARKRTA